MNNYQSSLDGAAARTLGWLSIGIGLTELMAPGQVTRLLGIEDRPECRGVLQVLGVRELGHGVSLLTNRQSQGRMAAGAWSRVAGDAIDTGLLAFAATDTKRPGAFAATSAMVMAIGALDLLCAKRLSR